MNYGILWDNYSKTIFTDTINRTSLWSDVAGSIDYYFIFGNTMDSVIAGYRNLTGQAPMYGKWAYGYWQSKEHYENRDELLNVVQEYRKRQIPIDNIIQDWDYWDGGANWGQLFFDEKKYPNPKEMIDLIHKQNFHIMISVWPGLGPNTPVYKDMDRHGYLYRPVGWAGFKYYDAYNPAANDLFWNYAKKGLFAKGIDGWWFDSTEPDVINALTKESSEYELKRMDDNFAGSFAKYLNPYSLRITEDFYKNLRRETDRQRVYILTRSTFAGQQRAAATTWSGDIGANWIVFKHQISAGINHCMSGIPYWTFDIGAFVIGSYEGVFCNGGKDPAYQEFYTRMFQFGTFCPIFRSHGSETPREIWEFGTFTPTLIKFDNLRYRLLPYIYSLAHEITDNGYTIMRGLPMDFAADRKTYSIDDQFMFGPAMMVCPVTEYMLHRPPEPSIPITAEHFKTNDGSPGLAAKYYNDAEFKNLTLERIDSTISIFWYAGRPSYVTDSTLSIRWEGKLIPTQTGTHQFHIKCFGPKKIILDGKVLPFTYQSVEVYTDVVELEAGKEYSFILETQNYSAGALRVLLNWKTPEIFAKEKITEQRDQTRKVYLPAGQQWYDFWTGEIMNGSQFIPAAAPTDKIPLLVKAGSIIPMGPFIQYAAEKAADPLELRIYPGADGSFTIYEDENDNYDYEKGSFSTILFQWNNAAKQLTIGSRQGSFPGMLENRTFHFIIVRNEHGTGVEITEKPDQSILYNGHEQVVQF
jgi:alpha-D-xyloside xylohydrolase